MHILPGRIAIFALSVCLITTLPAIAQVIPPGSYQHTCRDASVGDNDTLLANCQTANGGWRVTNLPNALSCRGDIANVDGRLQCTNVQPSGNSGNFGNQSGNATPSTTETGEGLSTFGAECDGKDGAEYLMLRMWGRTDSLVKLAWDKRYPAKVHIFVPRGTTYAITCGGFKDNAIFTFAALD
jgi:hypothetical protein